MTPAYSFAAAPVRLGWLARAEAWLDERGKAAWIVAMILGFVFFWPVGLGLLGYMIWSKRMFNKSGGITIARHSLNTFKSSGNSAFDAYKTQTLQRLEDEQQNFEAFLQRLRAAKDKSEFDAFMDERTSKAAQDANDGDLKEA